MVTINKIDKHRSDISLTRADSLIIEINLNDHGEPYTPSEYASCRFAMKKKYSDPDSEVVLVKNIPVDTMILELEPEDTKSLPMKSKYVYDIQFTDENNRVDTFIYGTFTITEEVI